MPLFARISAGSKAALKDLKQVTGETQSLINLYEKGGPLQVSVSAVTDELSIMQGNAATVQQAMEEMHAGGRSLTELMRDLEGDIVGPTSTKLGQILSEYSKLDPRAKQQELQELLLDIRGNRAEWDDFINAIDQGGNRIGARMRQLVDGLREGNLAIGEVIANLEEIRLRNAQKGSALDNAIDGILQDIHSGDLGPLDPGATG